MDIELALLDLSKNIVSLPKGYISEDRGDKGWGLVIRSIEDGDSDSVDDSIVSFLDGLVDIKDIIVENNPILRVAIYNTNVNYTLNLKCFKILYEFEVVLEASIYPEE